MKKNADTQRGKKTPWNKSQLLMTSQRYPFATGSFWDVVLTPQSRLSLWNVLVFSQLRINKSRPISPFLRSVKTGFGSYTPQTKMKILPWVKLRFYFHICTFWTNFRKLLLLLFQLHSLGCSLEISLWSPFQILIISNPAELFQTSQDQLKVLKEYYLHYRLLRSCLKLFLG